MMKRFARAASSFGLILMLTLLAVPTASAASMIPGYTPDLTPPADCGCNHTPTATSVPTQPPTEPPTVPPTEPPTQPPTMPPTTTPTMAPTQPVTPTATSTTPATAPATKTPPAKPTKTPAGTVVVLPVTGAGMSSGNGGTIWLLIGAATVLLAGAWTTVRRQRR